MSDDERRAGTGAGTPVPPFPVVTALAVLWFVVAPLIGLLFGTPALIATAGAVLLMGVAVVLRRHAAH